METPAPTDRPAPQVCHCTEQFLCDYCKAHRAQIAKLYRHFTDRHTERSTTE